MIWLFYQTVGEPRKVVEFGVSVFHAWKSQKIARNIKGPALFIFLIQVSQSLKMAAGGRHHKTWMKTGIRYLVTEDIQAIG